MAESYVSPLEGAVNHPILRVLPERGDHVAAFPPTAPGKHNSIAGQT